MFFIPFVAFAGVYYASRGFGMLVTSALSLLPLDGFLAKKESEEIKEGLRAGLNPFYEEFIWERARKNLLKLGLSAEEADKAMHDPGFRLQGIQEWNLVTIKEEDLAPGLQIDYLIGDWLLTTEEFAQLRDFILSYNLTTRFGAGQKLESICLEKNVEMDQVLSLSIPYSSTKTIPFAYLAWLRSISDFRRESPKFQKHFLGGGKQKI